MNPVSPQVMAFLQELDEVCRKHGLNALSPDEGLVVEDFHENASWVGFSKIIEDISRFSRGGANDQAQ